MVYIRIYLRYHTNLVNDGWLEVDKDSPGHMLASSSLGEEGVEAVVRVADGLVAGHGPVGLDTVLQAVELPAGIAHLDSGLTNMDRDTLTLKFKDGLVNENLGYL